MVSIYTYSYEIFENNYYKLYFQKSEQPYDYISIFFNNKNYSNIEALSYIVNALNDILDNNTNFSYYINPNIAIIEIYTYKNNTINILMQLIPIINANIQYDKFTFKSDNNFINTRFSIIMPKTVKPNIYINDKLHFIVNSNSEKQSIINILQMLNIHISNDKKSIYREKLKGEYKLNNLNRYYYFYDFNIKDQYILPELLLIKTLYNIEKREIDIIEFNDIYSLITADSIEYMDNQQFNKAKSRLKLTIENAIKSPYYALKFFPILMINNRLNYLKGIYKRLDKLSAKQLNDFIKSIKPSCVFIPQKESIWNENIEKIKLNNGITLLYRKTNNIHTNVSILLSDILSVENFYSKPFAAEIVFMHLNKVLNRWLFVPVSAFSDIKLINGNFANSEFANEYYNFINTIKNAKIENINTYTLDSIISIGNIMNSKEFVNIPLLNRRSAPNYDAITLTQGELNILKKKLFSSNRIIIAINTAISRDSIIDIFENNILFDIDNKLNIQHIDTDILNTQNIFMGNIFNKGELLYLSKLFLNFPFAINFYRYNVMYLKEYYYKRQLVNKNFYYNLMNRSGICMLMVLSQYLFNNPTHFFQ